MKKSTITSRNRWRRDGSNDRAMGENRRHIHPSATSMAETEKIKSTTILIVDDDEDTSQYLKILMESEGYKTTIFQSAREVLQYLHLHEGDSEDSDEDIARKTIIFREVDLILLDIILGQASGIDICRRINDDRILRHVPIIMITALSDQDEKRRGFYVGADDYITKPFSNEELLLRIRVMLRMRRLQDELVERQKRSEIGKLAIAVAHELNNPLCVINGNLDLLIERNEGDDYTLRHLQKIKKMTQKMIEIVEKMNCLKMGYHTVSYADMETMIDLSE